MGTPGLAHPSQNGPSGPGAAVVNQAGRGFMYGPGLTDPIRQGLGTAAPGSPGQVRAFQFVLTQEITITKVTVDITTADVANPPLGIAIYSADGQTKLLDAEFTTTTAIAFVTVTISAVILPPGVYWFAQAYGSAGTTAAFEVLSSSPVLAQILNFANNRQIIPTTSYGASGPMPATLGTIAAATPLTSGQAIVAVFEP
jgi:hypothetical protein